MNRFGQTMEKWFSSDMFSWTELRKMFLTLLMDQSFIYIISVLSTIRSVSVAQPISALVAGFLRMSWISQPLYALAVTSPRA